MNELKQKKILSEGFIISILFLVLNDFYLKCKFPGIITGKLSDFAGLFALPFFFSTLFPLSKKWIYVSTAFVFVLWKLPYSDSFISFWNQSMPYCIGRVVDYSDYLALIMLPISYLYQPNVNIVSNKFIRKVLLTCTISLSIFSFLATAGTHGNIKIYKLNYSKYEVNQAFQKFYLSHPNLIVPDKYKSLVTPHIIGAKGDEAINKLNADSVNFEFYFEDKDIVIWSSFVEAEDNWNNKPSRVAFEGWLILSEKKWHYNDDLSKYEKKELTDFFQREILEELEMILEDTHEK